MKVLLLALLCGLAMAGTLGCADPDADCCLDTIKLKQNLVSPLTLPATVTLLKVPGLKKTIDLEKAQLVHVSYVVSLYGASYASGYLVTKLFVDGVENKFFRAITGNTVYHTNHIAGFISLPAGDHTIKVMYRSDTDMTNVSADWSQVALQITY